MHARAHTHTHRRRSARMLEGQDNGKTQQFNPLPHQPPPLPATDVHRNRYGRSCHGHLPACEMSTLIASEVSAPHPKTVLIIFPLNLQTITYGGGKNSVVRRICAVTSRFQTTTRDLSVFPFLPIHYHTTRVLLSPFITTV